MNIPIRYQVVLILITVIPAVFFNSKDVFAHPGNTASDGCHYCKKNCDKWGVPWYERHCHGGGSSSAPPPVINQIVPIPPTVVPKPKIVYPSWTPIPTRPPKPTSLPRPTRTPIPSKTPIPTATPISSPTEEPTPSEIYFPLTEEPTLTSYPTSVNTVGEVAGVTTQNQKQGPDIFSQIFHFLTFGIFRGTQKLISPIK